MQHARSLVRVQFELGALGIFHWTTCGHLDLSAGISRSRRPGKTATARSMSGRFALERRRGVLDVIATDGKGDKCHRRAAARNINELQLEPRRDEMRMARRRRAVVHRLGPSSRAVCTPPGITGSPRAGRETRSDAGREA